MSAPEKVYPSAPPAGSPSPAGGVTTRLKTLDRKWWLGGAALVTVVVAATVGRRNDPEADDDEAGGAWSIDTSETDLAGRLDDISDQLEELGDRPRPPKPSPTPQNPGPQGNTPGPRPPGTVTTPGRTYRVKQGDTLKSIAKDLQVKGGAPRLYAVNRVIITRAAKRHNHPSPRTTQKLYPGTTLVIP